jgi:hypothetical protein
MIEDRNDSYVRYINYDLDEADDAMQAVFERFDDLDHDYQHLAHHSIQHLLDQWGKQLND